jgi:hypothetical protein
MEQAYAKYRTHIYAEINEVVKPFAPCWSLIDKVCAALIVV